MKPSKIPKLIALLIEERAVNAYLCDHLKFDAPQPGDIADKFFSIARRSVEAELNAMEKRRV